jgi:hypothetical protein
LLTKGFLIRFLFGEPNIFNTNGLGSWLTGGAQHVNAKAKQSDLTRCAEYFSASRMMRCPFF